MKYLLRTHAERVGRDGTISSLRQAESNPVMVVPDAMRALQALGKAIQSVIRFHPPTAGIVGMVPTTRLTAVCRSLHLRADTKRGSG